MTEQARQEIRDRYTDGQSIRRIARALSLGRATVRDALLADGCATDNRPRRALVDYCGRTYGHSHQGYYKATRDPKTYLHRDIYEKEVGHIPDGWQVHHKNGDQSDNRAENLEALPPDAHSKHHHYRTRHED